MSTEQITLSDDTLPGLPEKVGRPRYDRRRLRPGIVHFGVGGFHRAHQAMYLDTLMGEQPEQGLDWSIVGVGTMPGDARMRDAMAAQDCLFTLVVKHPDGRLEPRVLGAMSAYLFAPDDPEAVLAQLTEEQVRIVSLTITEGGYHVNQVTGEFDPADEALQEDIASSPGDAPRSAFGFITEALRRRREAGTEPFTVMSCDNLPGNGDVAGKMLTSFARMQDGNRPDAEPLAGWMEEHVQFPNSMVDRITPVTTQEDIDALADRFGIEDAWPVVCEPFTQWVLEDHFTSGRPAVEEVGVQVVEDVEPYELMKLRLLNASHQALCYLGYLAGYRYAHEVAQDPLFVDFLLGYMEKEGTPTLPEVPDVDLADYRQTLVERFANPEVRDTLARLCAESSDRIPKWLVPVIRHNLEHGGQIERSALVVASWARYAEGEDEQGEPIEVVDRYKDRVMAAAARQREEPLAFLEDETFFGDLREQEAFTKAYTHFLQQLHDVGARATLEGHDWS
ncbi:Multiple polyol-specific dehydrogenase [Serinicoccus hydrothermalis]|uniref:Mannitol-1-phosphate 5-dehydrogenase n=1 Tax=Serinicoccus hydrothermalis TaxID=1758689 RepID=A0A1B1N7L3_9MICO|nr:mannitol dehydrogenase family protein [Serinicoccus hydrothermalis]ANS77423.1 Multiple polyol-specific dehydrogenase [Serinicoccus hydrothermalis]